MNRISCCLAAVCMALVSVVSGQEPATQAALKLPKIDRYPAARKFRPGPLKAIPKYDPKGESFQVDLRWKDVSALDLRGEMDNLRHAIFDNTTAWPDAARMPPAEEFDPRRILELGANPGLGIRSLHQRGITGRGVAMAIIDMTLLVDHQEYKDRLRLYEEIGIFPLSGTEMHGPAVASLAVGKTVGVAPEADLYFIATRFGEVVVGEPPHRIFQPAAKAVRRILEVNRQLPAGRKIRVISMSVGWDPSESGYDDIVAAVKEATQQGIFVVSSSLDRTYGLKFQGLGRDALADPDEFDSYRPGSWWAGQFKRWQADDRLLVPMDCRTVAGLGATDEYTYYPSGGWSWSIPYLAASYVLAMQVDPDVTPQRFWEQAIKTGRWIHIKDNGIERRMGPILDLPAVIDALSRR